MKTFITMLAVFLAEVSWAEEISLSCIASDRQKQVFIEKRDSEEPGWWKFEDGLDEDKRDFRVGIMAGLALDHFFPPITVDKDSRVETLAGLSLEEFKWSPSRLQYTKRMGDSLKLVSVNRRDLSFLIHYFPNMDSDKFVGSGTCELQDIEERTF